MTHAPGARTTALRLVSLLAAAIVAGGCVAGSPAATAAGSRVVAPAPVGAASVSVVGSRSATTPPAGTGAATSPRSAAQEPATSSTSTGPATAAVPTIAAEPTIAQMIGQKLVVRMDGTAPSASLLGRIRRGEVGGVILFGDDISSESQLKALTAQLHAAAAAGGQPRLLIMTDQEGGNVRRITWAPPAMSARAMGNDGRTSTARTQGLLTGQAMRALGVDVDLAPVGDVPRYTNSFMWLQRRTFGFDPSTVSRLSNAFALGLRAGGTVATMKHFPGIGRAIKNTDDYVVTIPAPLTALKQRDLVPYRTAIANGIPMIMLSNANYPALDPDHGAGWSRAITKGLLRTQLGFRGVTITDSLTAAARTRGLSGAFLAMEAAAAGTDLVLVTGSEASTAGVYAYMLRKAEAHVIGTVTLKASYQRILALKAGL